MRGHVREHGPGAWELRAYAGRDALSVVRAALEQGVCWGWLRENRRPRASPGPGQPPEVRPPAPEAVLALLARAEVPRPGGGDRRAEASCWPCAGPTSTSTPTRSPSAGPSPKDPTAQGRRPHRQAARRSDVVDDQLSRRSGPARPPHRPRGVGVEPRPPPPPRGPERCRRRPVRPCSGLSRFPAVACPPTCADRADSRRPTAAEPALTPGEPVPTARPRCWPRSVAEPEQSAVSERAEARRWLGMGGQRLCQF